MSTLGKVFLFINLLLAIVVVTLFALTFGHEKRWGTSVEIHKYTFRGLPMDESEVDPDDPTYTQVQKLTKPVLDGVFEGLNQDQELGGGQVKTVLEELERVRGKVKSNITSAANEAEQRKLVAYYLIPLAKTIDERLELIRRTADPKVPVPELVNELESRFVAAKSLPGRSQQARHEQRVAVATLLYNVHSRPADHSWRQRVMRIVGMETYVAAIERQAQFVFDMAREMQALIAQDRAAFERSYADLIDVILMDAEDLVYLDRFLKDLNATLAERTTQVAQRKTEVENATTALNVSIKNSQTEMAKLNAIQNDLFALQQRLGVAFQRNQELEQELRRLESNKAGR